MKVRISGQSIRFRLSKADIYHLQKNGELIQSTQIGLHKDQALHYHVSVSKVIEPLTSFKNQKIKLEIPIKLADIWLNSEQVGWDFKQILNSGSELYILVEKDFQCLVPRPHENEENNYPNPLAYNS